MTKYKIVYKDANGVVHTELQRFSGFFEAVESVKSWGKTCPTQYSEILAIRERREGQ